MDERERSRSRARELDPDADPKYRRDAVSEEDTDDEFEDAIPASDFDPREGITSAAAAARVRAKDKFIADHKEAMVQGELDVPLIYTDSDGLQQIDGRDSRGQQFYEGRDAYRGKRNKDGTADRRTEKGKEWHAKEGSGKKLDAIKSFAKRLSKVAGVAIGLATAKEVYNQVQIDKSLKKADERWDRRQRDLKKEVGF